MIPKMNTFRFALSLFFSHTMLISPALSADKAYRWVDNEGKVHFSEHAPKNQPSEKLRISNPASSDAEISRKKLAKQREQQKNQPPKKPKEMNKLEFPQASEEECTQVSKNLDMLNQGKRVKTKNDKGEFEYLDEARQQKIRAENEAFASQYCNPQLQSTTAIHKRNTNKKH